MSNSAVSNKTIAIPVAVADGGTGATTVSGAKTNLSIPSSDIGVNFIIDGGVSTITTGLYGGMEVPFAMTITGWTLLSTDGTTGSIVIDVWKNTYANFPPTVANTITSTDKPTISSAVKGQNTAVSVWTTSVAKGDILYFNVGSVTSLKRVAITIIGTKL